MILDTSAVVAIAFKEPGFMSLVDKLAKASNIAIGVPTLTETIPRWPHSILAGWSHWQ